jgi:TetR/AcrR family transcriptional repressor of nem operon
MAVRGGTTGASTASRILDIGERLVQTRGYNAFSYADVAAELDVTKAALHYHFPGKAELGEALLRRYVARFADALAKIDAEVADAPRKIASYAEVYAGVLQRERMCLCGMLAAEFETLPEPMRAIVVGFFDDNEIWLAKVLGQGRREGSLTFTGSTMQAARFVVAALEGALLMARAGGGVIRFREAVHSLIVGLVTHS